MAQVGGARKLLRKYYSSNAVEVVGDEAIKLTGHDLRSTLDKHYWKQQINKVVPNADKVAQLFKKKVG